MAGQPIPETEVQLCVPLWEAGKRISGPTQHAKKMYYIVARNNAVTKQQYELPRVTDILEMLTIWDIFVTFMR